MISIIIPTLNEEKAIGNTLAGLSKLTLPHELIVSDGTSTDKTAEIARKYTDKVIVYSGTKRQTIAEGRNDGAAIATGSILVFMDADTEIKNIDAFFTRAISRFENDKKLVALNPQIKVMPDKATRADNIIFSLVNLYFWFMNDIVGSGQAAGEFQMVRAESFRKLGGYNGTLVAGEDNDLFRRLSKTGRVMFDGSLVIYHSGRRAHKIGWPKLLSIWIMTALSNFFIGRAPWKEWKVIR